jgi:transposase
MSTEKLPMRKLREIVRLKLQCGASHRDIATACGIARSTAGEYAARIAAAGLTWPLPSELEDDAALERLLFPHEGNPSRSRPGADWARVHAELKRKHVTLMLLWQEYRQQHPDGVQYSQFCDYYARWLRHAPVTMRQEHRAGEKAFVDFSGDGIDIVDPKTGEVFRTKLFVAVLGASSLTYVEPVLDETLPTWIGCHVRAFDFFGGVPEIVVPDNLKSGVKRPDRYEPEINPTYADWAQHYGCAVIPARVRRPRDKAKVESAVLLAERWILAVLRNRTFYSLNELHEAIIPLVEKLNIRPMRKLKKSRRDLFEAIDKPALRPLPEHRYELAEWKTARVNIDYHVAFEDHLYSVPYTLAKDQVDVRATVTCVEIFHRGKRVASHVRSSIKYKHTTRTEHMPASHRAHLEWTPSRITNWAATIGPCTASLAEQILASRPHPEQGFRSCLGIIRLGQEYSNERLERACAWAVRHRAISYRSVVAILKNNRDRLDEADTPQVALPLHSNVRGPGYYH